MKLVLVLFGAFVTLSTAVAAGWTTGLDRAATAAAVAGRTPFWDSLAMSISGIGNAPVVIIAVVLAATYCALARRPRYFAAVLWTPLAFLLDTGVKALVRHPRPLEVAIAPLPADYGYPSGHATVTMAFWLILALLVAPGDPRPVTRRFLVYAAVGVAVLVAWSRVYLGVHSLTDVCGGLLLGSAGAVAAARMARRGTPEDLTLRV